MAIIGVACWHTDYPPHIPLAVAHSFSSEATLSRSFDPLQELANPVFSYLVYPEFRVLSPLCFEFQLPFFLHGILVRFQLFTIIHDTFHAMQKFPLNFTSH